LRRRIRQWLSDPAILQEVRHVGSKATAQKRAIERARKISTGGSRYLAGRRREGKAVDVTPK